MERELDIVAGQDPIVTPVEGAAPETVDPEIEARINRGYRGLIRDIVAHADLDPAPEELASCRSILEAGISPSSFNPRLRAVLGLRYGIEGEKPLTLRETGLELGLSEGRIGQLQAKAIRILSRRKGREIATTLGLYDNDQRPPQTIRIRRIDNL